MPFKWNGPKVQKMLEDVAFRALIEGGEALKTESQDETPILSGTLRRSGAVTPARQSKKVYVSYNTPYALIQHEGGPIKPHEIKVRAAKVLAVPVSKYNGPVNDYKSKSLPKLSKDGKYVILGRKVRHPGCRIEGTKYLENPFNRMKPDIQKHVAARVRAATKGGL